MTTAQITSTNQAVQWMINNVQSVNSACGVEDSVQWSQREGFFKGTLPSGMVTKLNGYLKSVASQRGSNGQSVYNWSENNVSFTIRKGARKSTQNSVQFSFCETVTEPVTTEPFDPMVAYVASL